MMQRPLSTNVLNKVFMNYNLRGTINNVKIDSPLPVPVSISNNIIKKEIPEKEEKEKEKEKEEEEYIKIEWCDLSNNSESTTNLRNAYEKKDIQESNNPINLTQNNPVSDYYFYWSILSY